MVGARGKIKDDSSRTFHRHERPGYGESPAALNGDVIGGDGTSFRLYYGGRFGDTVDEHAGGIKASLPF